VTGASKAARRAARRSAASTIAIRSGRIGTNINGASAV